MCLGVPGRVVKISDNDDEMKMGTVNFGGVSKEVCLAYVPEVKIGDFVIVHVGFAISIVDENEAKQVFEDLEQMDRLKERGDRKVT